MTQDTITTPHPTANLVAFPYGSKVKVAERYRELSDSFGRLSLAVPLHMDTAYVVESCRSAATGFMVKVENLRYEYPSDYFVLAEAPEGYGYIPFSLTKQTSREYALGSDSAKLEDQHRKVLQAAGFGDEVDASAFRKAVTAALSLAATRGNKSSDRKEFTKMARHLLYIVDAVLDNALQGLPPVDPGARSPRIRQLERELAEAQQRTLEISVQLEKSENRTGLEQDRSAALIREKTEVELQWQRLAESARENSDVLNFVLGHADEVLRGKAEGYREGLRDARS